MHFQQIERNVGGKVADRSCEILARVAPLAEMNRVTVCIVAQNEEENLPRLLKSVAGIADEVVLVDGGSRDRTHEVAREYGAKVCVRPYDDQASQKNYAASEASNNWILMLDADEELSEELKESLGKWKCAEPSQFIYEMARRTWYLGAWIHHSRWYPDWQKRLYRRDKASVCGPIHSGMRYQGKVGRVGGDLLHYTVRDFAEHERKLERFTDGLARQMFDEGKRNWRAGAWVAAPWSWFRHFFLSAGFLDGYRGALIAKMAARAVWLKYHKLGGLVRAEKLSRVSRAQ